MVAAQASESGASEVSIAFRSPRFLEAEIGPFQLTEVWFAPETRIEPHHHNRPNIGIMLGGAFELAFKGSTAMSCDAGTCFVEPAGATHCNCIRCQGAHVLAIQPDPANHELFEPLRRLVDAPGTLCDPRISAAGRRITAEMAGSDSWSKLAIEGLILEVLALAARLEDRHRGRRPPWLDRIEALLRDPSAGVPSVAQLAREAGVHPTHLARSFRRASGRSIGRFLLERRIEWAARRLDDPSCSISSLAVEVGFVDQSHFTRRFRQVMGMTPGRYRATADRTRFRPEEPGPRPR